MTATLTPRIPVDPPPPPPDIPPSVSIIPPSGRVVDGVATLITVSANRGTHFFFIPQDNDFGEEPIVTYTDTELDFDGNSIRDHRGGGGTYPVTFVGPGDHVVNAFCRTTTGQIIQATPVTVHVVAAVPPTFTIAAPTDGTVVPLGEGGQQIDLHVTIPTGQPFPMKVTAAWEGHTTTSGDIQTGDYATKIGLDSQPLGPVPITVTVADRDGIAGSKTVTVTAQDNAPPHVAVDFPQPSANVIGESNGQATVAMHGTATDSQSGMIGGQAGVAWALTKTGDRTKAVAVSGNDFRTWRADVVLTGFGAHTIFVWATDQAGNTMTEPLAVPVVVISSFAPLTLEERLNEREYLAGLLSFAQEQVRTAAPPAGVPVDTATLVGVLGQPVDRLSQPLSAAVDQGGQEVNQLRVPVELLRARIAATHASTTPGTAGEANYRTTAYNTLLAAIGTSYAELRLARAAAADVRQALAARLGIQLSPTRPDQLDQLILDGTALTEAALETVFGLPNSTAADPLRVPPTPLLRTWRLAGLSAAWAAQDQHPNAPRAFAVLADPDVIGAPDVTKAGTGDPIRALLAARAKVLSDYAQMLDGIRTGKPDPVQALAAIQAQALPGVDLADLETKDGRGIDIAPALAAAGLTRAGFVYLRKLARVAATGTVTAAEWTDAIAVLTGAHKATLFPTWRAQESGFVLSPDFFVLADPGPVVNPYRVDGRARTEWKSVLRIRTAQRQDVLDANAAAVSSAEQVALPILRDALLADLAPATTGDVGEEMSALFLVDVLAGGTLRTTRIRQAIESVQSLLSALRNGELAAGHPAFAWTLASPKDFTNAWVWLGEWGSWRAATMAFLFPERHLDPALLVPNANTDPPHPLDELFAAIRGSGPFNGATANKVSGTYLGRRQLGFSSYLDPRNRIQHQSDLQTQSALHADFAQEAFWAVPMLLAQRLQSAGDYQAALDWYWLVYPYDLTNVVSIYHRIGQETVFRPDLTFPPGWSTALDPFRLVANRPVPFTRYTLLSIIRCHVDFADAEFTRETDESVAHARTLYLTALRLLRSPKLQPQQPTNPGEPALAIPELDVLRGRATAQLAKLRQGRNIAGMPRSRDVSAATTVSQPTPFRFKVLMDRAKQLTAQAGQIEAGYLAALEKYDDRSLRVFDALKGIDLSQAQVSLATARVKEAGDAVTAAVAQRTKADVMVSTYGGLLDAPQSQYEKDLLHQFNRMRDIRNNIVAEDAAITVMQAAMNAGSIIDIISSGGGKAALAVGIGAVSALKVLSQKDQNDLDAQIQTNQLKAGIEQRTREWRVQQTAAQQESLVAQAQVVTATDHVAIAVQEQSVAALQHDQAVATLKFLTDQFTNADLYLWLSNTLGAVYRYFLQQATATARLAQAQLGFERAEAAQTLIRNDYWQSPAELTAGGAAPNRRGLTGAEQLSEDLARLDDYAFSTERRRLNLSQTFSLARLMPVEFLEFRRTGTLAFATPMSLFDADFPGHYLRMIRQVRTSVVALVPTDHGMRATLYSNGISRVTTRQDGVFGDIVVRHDPTLVALTSPVNANGVFDLDLQSDMLLPFESSGVDTTWELNLPPAANPMDFGSIVDVLVTIEYTALSDEDYRRQVTTRLNADRTRGADRVFSLSRDFPDQWYDLNNPANPADRSVTLTLRDVDFPLGVDSLATAALAVRLASDQPVPDTVVTLKRGTTGGDATATDGIASTRRGNAPAWLPLAGTDPVGDWQLRIGTGADALFAAGALEDILLIVSWTAQGPAWTR